MLLCTCKQRGKERREEAHRELMTWEIVDYPNGNKTQTDELSFHTRHIAQSFEAQQ